MNKVIACKRCKKLFESDKVTDYCPLCQRIIDKAFKRVRDYVRRYKGAGINEVSEACEIPVKQLIRWIREERLFFAEGAEVALPCLNCGDLISYGEYCAPCKRKMMMNLKSIYVEAPTLKKPTNKVNDALLLGNNNRLRRIR